MHDQILNILLAHNTWATRVIIDSCESLAPEQLHQRFDIGLGSLHDTLLHITGAMLRWSDRVGGRAPRPSPTGKHTVEQLRNALEEAARSLDETAKNVLEAGALQATLELAFDGRVLRFSKAAALAHVVTHGMHHRAQALNMLRQLGRTELVDNLDVIDWALQHDPR
jgi:uncharacterized damage-inducible protein DinB